MTSADAEGVSPPLRVAGWALDGAPRAVGDDPQPSMETVAAVMAAKREIGLAGLEVCDLAMEVTGGRGFFRDHRSSGPTATSGP